MPVIRSWQQRERIDFTGLWYVLNVELLLGLLANLVTVCCSYQCLRMTNFLSQPTIEAIQTLLVIGNVLSYNMNPGISYVLLGMTLRMGLALGLHVESSRFSAAERYRRRHTW
jgi:hypothetical protein